LSGDDLEVLMERYADGDTRAFEELYVRVRPLLLYLLRRKLPTAEAAEDVLQLTMFRIHRVRDRYRRGAPVIPWISTIAHRLAVDWLRSGDNRERAFDPEMIERFVGAEPEPELDPEVEGEIITAVRAAIESLPDSSRDLVRAHKLEERSISEAARMIGIKEGAARVRAHRAYKLLAVKLASFRARRGDSV
jgi:RNA polymerase sigma-70 factor (ECF subfamily)